MKKSLYILLLAALGFSGCNYLELQPVGQVIPHKTSEFRGLLTQGYLMFPYYDSKTYTGLLSDEVGYFNEGYFYEASTAIALSYNYTWDYGRQMKEYPYEKYYLAIFQANAVIDGVMDAEKDSDEPKEQILGEAYALRAYSHFDLVNLYGKPYNAATAATDRGVPLATYIDIEQKYRPSTVAKVYEQILEDIKTAEGLMTVEKQTEARYNYRFSLDAVHAFKARVMLYMGNWQEAYNLATELLPKYTLVDFNGLTDKNTLPWKGTSTEVIMALERPFSGGSGDLTGASLLSDKIMSLIDQANDNRFAHLAQANVYDGSYQVIYSGYKITNRSSSDRVSIRHAEMYLIAAEAAAHLDGKLSEAKNYLLGLQEKRFKPEAMEAQRAKIEAMDAAALLQEIADERGREFIGEGQRWMDLRRTTQPEITKTYDGSTYTLHAGDSRYTLPFPQSAIDSNPDLNN